MSGAEGGVRARDALVCELVGDLLRSGHSARLGVRGTSMLPSLWPGDRLRIRPADPRTLDLGEVVLCAREGRLIAHRLVDLRARAGGPLLITRGDRLRHRDSPFGPEALVGRVVAVERPGRAPAAVPAFRGWRRVLGWMLGRSGRLTGWALRLRALTAGRRADPQPLTWSG